MIRNLLIPKATVIVVLLLSGCGDSLIFTEKTGFNASINIDAAQGSPVETNLGLTRRVAGLVPPIRRNSEGKSAGEAANLVGGFQVVQDPDENNVFNTTVRVASGYATGPAALALVGELPKTGQESLLASSGETAEATESKNQEETLAAVTSVMRPAQAARQATDATSLQKACLEQGSKFTQQKNADGKIVGACTP